MNKKFSTLVAALLASGGLFYAVDAMILPAGDGVAKTFVTAAATKADAAGTIIGYTLATGDYSTSITADWSLESATTGKFYLQIGEGFYLNSKLQVQKGKEGAAEFTVANGVVDGLFIENGVLAAAGETPAGLFTSADGAIASNAAAGTSYLLGGVTYAEATLNELTATSPILKMAAAEEAKATIEKITGTGGGVNISATVYLESVGVGQLVMKAATGYVNVSSEGAISYTAEVPSNSESLVALGTEDNVSKVMFGEKYLKIEENEISLTTTANDGKAYLVDGDISSTSATAVTELNANKAYCLLGQNTKGTVADNDFSVTFAAAKTAVYEGVALGAGNLSNFTGVDVSSKFSTTVSTGDLKLADAFVVWSENGPALSESTGSNYTLQTDGSFAYAGNKLKLGEDILYAYSAKGTIKKDAGTASSNLVLSAKSENSAVNDLSGSSKVSVATATYAEEGVPGADIEGMGEEVTVAADGTIELVGGVVSTDAIPAPFTVTSEDDVLKANSWILVGGKLKSLAAEKAGKKAMYLGDAPTKATAYALVEEANAITGITYTAEGLSIKGSIAATTPKTTGEALAVANASTSVNSGNIVKIVVAGTADDALFKITVSQVAGTDTYAYTFAACDAHGVVTDPDATLPIYMGGKYDGSVSLKLDGKWQAYNASSNAFENSTDGQKSIGFKVVAATADAKAYTVDQLLNDFGSRVSFGVTLKHKYTDEDGDAATKAITTGNVFADADLVPVKYVANPTDGKNFVELTGDKNAKEDAFLLKSGDRYIVLETTKDSEWTSIKTDLKNGGYKFTTVSEKAMLEILTKQGTFNKGDYAPYFTFSYDNVKNEGGKDKAVYCIEVKDYNKTALTTALYISSFEVKTGAQKGVYLTVTNDNAYWVAAELGLNNLVKAKSDNSPLNYTYVNIEFANHPSVKGKDGKVLNGRVPSASGVYTTADKSEMLFNKPEGQWIVNVGGQSGELNKKGVAGLKDATSFTFVNRESNESFTVNAMYYLGDNKYAVSSNNYAASPANRDTLIITGIKEDVKAGSLQRDGYADLKTMDVQDELFRLLVASTEEDYYVGENHTAKSHFLGLSHDEAAAVNWRIVPLTGAREYDKDGILKTASDSIYELRYSQYFKDDKLFSKNDTIAIIGYALQNTANDEYLTYETPQTTTIQSMICDPNFKSFKTTKDVSAAYRFVLKEKATDLYNIVKVNGDVAYDKDGYTTQTKTNPFTLGSEKLYGATTLTKQGAVEVESIYEKINSNDLFKVQKVGAPEYRLQSMGDTIRIFRQENDYDQMYENGEFLNLGNKAQLTTMAPALYVDTAYVKRGNNNRYQYLLVVNPEYKAATFDNANHQLTPDTTYGRFLVNLVDTANVAYQNGAIHANKYINDTEAGESFAKLGFVYGFRTADKLYITDKNYKKSAKASDVIDLGTSDFNTAKFAFRYIDPINHEADGSFKIQTGYYDYNSYIAKNKQPEVANNGYLKNINGVVVVANGYEAGDKFDLAAEHSNPTANEGINTSEVSVIAKEGEVVINGAAGKTVVITNVLGQTIASTILSSDNATISAPAGIVVVAVEGEAAVKAIVK